MTRQTRLLFSFSYITSSLFLPVSKVRRTQSRKRLASEAGGWVPCDECRQREQPNLLKEEKKEKEKDILAKGRYFFPFFSLSSGQSGPMDDWPDKDCDRWTTLTPAKHIFFIHLE